MQIFWMIGIGLIAGILSGLFGIGGGIILIPSLILLLHCPQKTANGISLVALLLPVGILGVIQYFKAGKMTEEHIRYGLMIACGLFIGVYIGSKFAIQASELWLRKGFALLLLGLALKMWLTSPTLS